VTAEQVSASDRLAVAVGASLGEFVSVRTSFNVKRWDDDQTRWALRRWERDSGGRAPLDRGLNVTLDPAVFRRYAVAPYSETQQDDCNLIVQSGWVALLGGVAGSSIAAKFSSTNGRIGVGTSSTGAAYTQTWLQGDTGAASTTSYYQLCGATPTITTATTPPTLVFTATFGTGVANFTWAEFGTDNAVASGVYLNGLAGGYVLLNRGVSAQGTKTSGQTWTATETITFGYPSGSGSVS
jgi:hypothetical protein